MVAPSTIRSRNAIASGGSPRYSPHFSKSMFVTNAVDRSPRTLISLYNKLAAWGDSSRSTRSKPNSSRITRSNLTRESGTGKRESGTGKRDRYDIDKMGSFGLDR